MTDAPSVSPASISYWPIAASFAVTICAVPIVRRVAVTLGLYDKPDGGLKPHQHPIPYLGGVGMFCGWLASLGCVYVSTGRNHPVLLWLAGAGAVLMLTGLVDDLRHLPPKFRLLMQATVALMLLGVGVGRGISRPLLDALPAALPGGAPEQGVQLVLSAGLCIFILAGATNATNLIDGMDGLCAGVLAIVAVGFALLDVLPGGAPGLASDAHVLRSALVQGMMGCCLGFLFFNFNPASIFMGDSGSLLLGFNVAAIMILFGDAPSWRGLAGCGLIFGFPILDTALAITRRWLNRRPLFLGDRSHIYDQLRDRGLSVRRVVIACYGIGLVFSGLGVVLTRLPLPYLVAGLVLTPTVAALICVLTGLLRRDAARKTGEQGG